VPKALVVSVEIASQGQLIPELKQWHADDSQEAAADPEELNQAKRVF
jgi:hypothetical protein